VTKEGYADVVSNAIDVVDNQSTNITIQMQSSTPFLEVVNDNNQKIDSLYFSKEDYDILLSISIWNSGSSSLEWAIICPAPWIQSISKESGVLAANSKQSVTITIDREKLNNGENTSVLYITSNGGNKTLKIIAVEEDYNKLPTFVYEGSTYRVHPGKDQVYQFSYAQSACNGIMYDGKADWFLPSKAICEAMYDSAIPDFIYRYYWWNATGGTTGKGCYFDFAEGDSQCETSYYAEYHVRCVRREN
jgi:hypothetical protein